MIAIREYTEEGDIYRYVPVRKVLHNAFGAVVQPSGDHYNLMDCIQFVLRQLDLEAFLEGLIQGLADEVRAVTRNECLKNVRNPVARKVLNPGRIVQWLVQRPPWAFGLS